MHKKLSKLINQWFDAEHNGQTYIQSNKRLEEIDLIITNMDEPLSESANAWKEWSDFENRTDKSVIDPTMYKRTLLCAYAEWSAKKDLGINVSDFEGVPQLTVMIE